MIDIGSWIIIFKNIFLDHIKEWAFCTNNPRTSSTVSAPICNRPAVSRWLTARLAVGGTAAGGTLRLGNYLLGTGDAAGGLFWQTTAGVCCHITGFCNDIFFYRFELFSSLDKENAFKNSSLIILCICMSSFPLLNLI